MTPTEMRFELIKLAVQHSRGQENTWGTVDENGRFEYDVDKRITQLADAWYSWVIGT